MFLVKKAKKAYGSPSCTHFLKSPPAFWHFLILLGRKNTLSVRIREHLSQRARQRITKSLPPHRKGTNKKASLREGGGPLAVEGVSVNKQILLFTSLFAIYLFMKIHDRLFEAKAFPCTRTPPPSFVGSPLAEGALAKVAASESSRGGSRTKGKKQKVHNHQLYLPLFALHIQKDTTRRVRNI